MLKSKKLLTHPEFIKYYNFKKSNLPTRAFNVLSKCEEISESYNDDLYDFLNEGFPYLNYQNVGRKTKYDLELFFKDLSVFLSMLKDDRDFNPEESKNKLVVLSEGRKIRFANYYSRRKDELSRRAKNILSNQLSVQENDFLNIHYFFNQNHQFFISLENCGQKSAIELYGFFKELQQEYNKIEEEKELDESGLFALKLFSLTKGKIQLNKSHGNRSPFVWFFDIVEATFNERDDEIARLHLINEYPIKQIAPKVGLTFERVRQLLPIINKKVAEVFLVILKEFKLKMQLIPDQDKGYSHFTDQEFGAKYGNYFSLFSYTFNKSIVPIIFDKYGYVFIPAGNKFFGSCSRQQYHYDEYNLRRYTTKNWLIDEKVISRKIVKKTGTKVLKMSCDKIENDMVVPWSALDVETVQHKIFFKSFFEKEMNISSDDEGIFLTKNTPMNLVDYIYIALEEIDKMASLDEIMEKLDELFPNRSKPFSENSVRSNLVSNKELFIYERRQLSFYGLKIWEKEKGLKGGTIREMAEKYLMDQGTDCHIQKIAEHIIQYRKNTNVNSVKWNLHQDPSKTFVFYKGGKVGLTNKAQKNFSPSSKENLDNFIDKLFDY